MKTFKFSLLTPEGIVVSDDVEMVEARSTSGAFGIMASHQPMIADCPSGRIRLLKDGSWRSYDCDVGVFAMDGTSAQLLTAFAKPSEG